jgi:hypothetical protein
VKMDESGRLTSVMKFEFEGEKVSYERRSTTTELFMKHVHDHDVHGAHQHLLYVEIELAPLIPSYGLTLDLPNFSSFH